MKQIGLLAAIMLLSSLAVYSQQAITGTIKDSRTGETLPGAHVVLKNTYTSTVSRADGSFRINSLKSDRYVLQVSYVGYESIEKEVLLDKESVELEVLLTPRSILSDEVIITATRATERTPVTFENIGREEIQQRNLGKDIPMLLDHTPALVTTSDAGAGVGYTGLRIRGTGVERINFTINGIPLNDAESHGVFFVNMPDLASSVSNIQIQRGVGTSTSGAAAFGASIDIQTHELRDEPYGEVTTGYGSFNTQRATFTAGTGLINDHWTFDARFSQIHSDGFIDRAFSDLRSFKLSGGYYGKNNVLRVMVLSGQEHTYQAWYGVPKDSLETNRTYNHYTYDNETDNYQQTHYQLHYSHQLNRHLRLNTALHMTTGEGYYESYKGNRSYEEYALNKPIVGNDTLAQTDLIQQKWLDNIFYGIVYSLHYESQSRISATIGGSANRYDGAHFGEVIWAKRGFIPKNHQWYENTGIKTDYSMYGKVNYHLSNDLLLYGDLQYRHINYSIDGIHDDLRDLTQEHTYNFFNPKAGIFYDINSRNTLYGTIGIAHREPNRVTFRDANPGDNPTEERMIDYELGYNYQTPRFAGGANLYYMDYTDQLVMTGEINNVGAPLMRNIPESYRAGIELTAATRLGPVEWSANAAFSQNKIKNFTAYVDNQDTWPQQEKEEQGTTDISFSPNVVASNMISWNVLKNMNINLISKYVGQQYIDNTSSKERSLDPYFISDLQLEYRISTRIIPHIHLNFMVNNIFDTQYESNAWVYRYYSEGKEHAEDGYYPQAGIHFMSSLSLRF